MLRPRIIPCLLIHDSGLVKTVRFAEPKYVGDPLNAVRIFNEKEVDELMVLDIDATVQSRGPDYTLIEHIAAECRMPLCYGGGVRSAEQVERIVSLGVEKVALSSAVIEDPELIRRASQSVGSQSVVAVLDVKRVRSGKYEVRTRNGRQPTGRDPESLARELAAAGVGEIVLNSIDNDGMMKGYDLESIAGVRRSVDLPMTVLGGAGSLDDMSKVIAQHGAIGVAAGSLFVFKGAYRAVLINYPGRSAKDKLMLDAFDSVR